MDFLLPAGAIVLVRAPMAYIPPCQPPFTMASPRTTMLVSLLHLFYVLASMVWLGGMFFAHFCLRPAAQQLEPPVRI